MRAILDSREFLLGVVERTKSAVVVERLHHSHEGDIMPNKIQEMNLEEYREESTKFWTNMVIGSVKPGQVQKRGFLTTKSQKV